MEARRVVLGIDGSAGAAAAARWAAQAVRTSGGEVIAVHGVKDLPAMVLGMGPSSVSKWKREVSRALDELWCEPLRDAGVPYRPVLADVDPVDALLDTARREDADLIVVGSQGGTGFIHRLFGGLSDQLIHHAHRPIVVVPVHTSDGHSTGPDARFKGDGPG